MSIRTVPPSALAPILILAALACGTDRGRPEPAETPAEPAARPVDTRAIAEKLVQRTLNVQRGEIILLAGGLPNMRLLEDLAVEVRKSGGWPLLQVGTEQLSLRLYEEVPPEFDRTTSPLALGLYGMVHGVISIDYIENNALFAGVPPARIAARAAADQPVTQLALRRGVRQVSLGNGLLPTASNASQFGVPRDTLAAIFWAGIDTDYDTLQARAERVRAVLAAGREARLTNPNGTDLTVRIAGRPVYASDGVISPADVRRGGAATTVYLPAGEVYLAPVPGTATGRVVIDYAFFRGTRVEQLRLSFEKGRLTDMQANSGLETLKALYDASGPGKDVFAVLDIGVNPDVRLVPGSQMLTWMPSGMVTIGLGNNLWAGGSNASGFGFYPFLPGSTLEIDGRAVVRNGELVL